jgi:hypothetical protein
MGTAVVQLTEQLWPAGAARAARRPPVVAPMQVEGLRVGSVLGALNADQRQASAKRRLGVAAPGPFYPLRVIGGASGVGTSAGSIGKVDLVITELAEHPGAKYEAEFQQTAQDLGLRAQKSDPVPFAIL